MSNLTRQDIQLTVANIVGRNPCWTVTEVREYFEVRNAETLTYDALGIIKARVNFILSRLR